MDVGHGIGLFMLGGLVSIIFFYIILTVMSNEGLDDKDSDDSI